MSTSTLVAALSSSVKADDVPIGMAVLGGAYAVGAAAGVRRYASQRAGWDLHFCFSADLVTEHARHHGIRGLIVQMPWSTEARVYRDLGIPIVNIADVHSDRTFPTVISNNREIGKLAAEHLLDQGLCHFAFTGTQGHSFAEQRCKGFCDRLRDAGRDVLTHFISGVILNDLDPHLRWLKSLPKPIGLMTENDVMAEIILRRCGKIGLEVPRDISLIGVDNDLAICELSRIPFSSVTVNAERVGYEAAALLDRLMAGQRPPAHTIEVPPVGVVGRQSTGELVFHDRLVRRAITALRQRLAEPCSLDDLASELGVSHRHLTRRFYEVVGRTPLEERTRLRIERAKHLLAMTSKSVIEVALGCGFGSANRFSTVFRSSVGMTPSAYRRSQRAE